MIVQAGLFDALARAAEAVARTEDSKANVYDKMARLPGAAGRTRPHLRSR